MMTASSSRFRMCGAQHFAFPKPRHQPIQLPSANLHTPTPTPHPHHPSLVSPKTRPQISGVGSLDTLDPAALAALPASVQLELLAKLREQRFAENQQSFQRASNKAPQDFSELQLTTFLKVRVSRGLGGRMAGVCEAAALFQSSRL